MKPELITLRTHVGPEGCLSFVEAEQDVDFPFKRMYYIYGMMKGVMRGFHAHKTLQQLLICMCGTIEIILDDGRCKQSVLLDAPDKGLIVRANVWREMLWREDNAVLCVLASAQYDEADYIRDYDVFMRFIGESI